MDAWILAFKLFTAGLGIALVVCIGLIAYCLCVLSGMVTRDGEEYPHPKSYDPKEVE